MGHNVNNNMWWRAYSTISETDVTGVHKVPKGIFDLAHFGKPLLAQECIKALEKMVVGGEQTRRTRRVRQNLDT